MAAVDVVSSYVLSLSVCGKSLFFTIESYSGSLVAYYGVIQIDLILSLTTIMQINRGNMMYGLSAVVSTYHDMSISKLLRLILTSPIFVTKIIIIGSPPRLSM